MVSSKIEQRLLNRYFKHEVFVVFYQKWEIKSKYWYCNNDVNKTSGHITKFQKLIIFSYSATRFYDELEKMN